MTSVLAHIPALKAFGARRFVSACMAAATLWMADAAGKTSGGKADPRHNRVSSGLEDSRHRLSFAVGALMPLSTPQHAAQDSRSLSARMMRNLNGEG